MIRTLPLLVAATSFLALHVAAQDQPSVAEAARRARQQKQASAKPSSVITNDTLAPAPAAAAAPSASSDTAAATQAATDAAESAEKKPAATSNDDAEQKKQDIAELKEQMAQKQAQLKFLQSDLALKQDTFYRNPDYQRDTTAKNKLDSLQSDIKQAQDELAALQAKLADLGPQDDPKPSQR